MVYSADRQQEQENKKDDMSLSNLNLVSFGYALTITWFGLILWSPIAIPTFIIEQGVDYEAHILRFIMLTGVLCVYLLVQFFPMVILNKTIKTVGVIFAVVASPLPILGNVVPALNAFLATTPILVNIIWGLAGFSAAMLMLIWGYDMSTKQSHSQGIINVSMGHVFCGGVFVLYQFMQPLASVILTIAMPFLLLAIWISRRPSQNTEDPEEPEHAIARSNVRAALGRGAYLFIFSYGFIMGIAGSVATQFIFMDYIHLVFGLPSMLAGLLMYFAIKKDVFKSGRFLFIAFLPFSVGCLFVLSVVPGPGKLACIALMFFVTQCYNVMNTAYTGGGSSAREFWRSYDFFSCESRTADMLGASLGWLTGTVIQFVVDPARISEAYFLIAVFFVLITIISSMQDVRKAPEDEEEETGSGESVSIKELEEACQRVAAQAKLSTREKEVFYLLSRGRDRQYIHSQLFISPSTVRTHTYNIYQKMDIHNQQQIIDIVEENLKEHRESEGHRPSGALGFIDSHRYEG